MKKSEQIKIRDAYRRAAVKLFGISEHEASVYIVAACDDKGEWAEDAVGIIYTEADCRTAGDTGTLADLLDYYDPHGDERLAALDEAAGMGCFIERINAAVCAVSQ